jgi:peptidoglycan/xylan/chitin deacetylase (PgdA/CDA1 family)
MISRIVKKINKAINHQVIVLMYHRVSELETDPWQLAVSPNNFEEQLQVLKESFKVISINELNQQMRSGKIKSDGVCITFDDGYRDNYRHARPLLEKYDCPATFFISASYIAKNRQFWWDELENIILHSEELPADLSINIGHRPYTFKLGDIILTHEIRQKHRYWNYLDPFPSQRCELYFQLWELIQPLLQNQIEQSIGELKKWASYTKPAKEEDLPMNKKELKEMFSSPLFTMGTHTLNHQLLPAHSKQIQQYEIVECRNWLEDWSGKKIDLISYPYGNYDINSLAVIKEQNFRTAFTCEESLTTKKTNSTTIGRFQVKNQNGSEFKKQIKHWLKFN